MQNKCRLPHEEEICFAPDLATSSFSSAVPRHVKGFKKVLMLVNVHHTFLNKTSININ